MGNEKEFDFNSEDFNPVDYENMTDEEFANDSFVKWLRSSYESEMKAPAVFVPNPKMITLAEQLTNILKLYAKGFVYGDVPTLKTERIDDMLLIEFTAGEMTDGIGDLLVNFIPLVSDFAISGKKDERVSITFTIDDFFIKMKS